MTGVQRQISQRIEEAIRGKINGGVEALTARRVQLLIVQENLGDRNQTRAGVPLLGVHVKYEQRVRLALARIVGPLEAMVADGEVDPRQCYTNMVVVMDTTEDLHTLCIDLCRFEIFAHSKTSISMVHTLGPFH